MSLLLGPIVPPSLAAALVGVALALASNRTGAEEPPSASAPPADAPEQPAFHEPRPERTWLFLEEPQLPAPLHAVAISRVTYTSSGVSPTRPFASNLAAPGAVVELGGELGVLPWLSVVATGVLGELSPSNKAAGGAVAGLRFNVLPRSLKSTRLVLSAGYLRELGGGNGAWARAAFTQDVRGLRLGVVVHGEHVFAPARDAVDVMVMAGATYHVVGPLRVGVEYVGQDLEESFDDEAEGGARHFIGPVTSFELLDNRLSIVVGPAVGLSYGSPKILGRAALAFAF